MTVDLYVKNGANYYKLDVEVSEVINLKTVLTDLNDISKVLSPFTQSFNLKATPKNLRLLAHFGNEKLDNTYNKVGLECSVYIGGQLFDSGMLKVTDTVYENKQQKSFKCNYASNLTGIADLLGEMTIQDLFKDENGNYDSLVSIPWTDGEVNHLIQVGMNVNLSNGINMKYAIPFMSNKRVWVFSNDLSLNDNIKYNPVTNQTTENYINKNEIRPSITYSTIMEHLLLKLGSPVICPWFNTTDYKDLNVYCSNENIITVQNTFLKLTKFTTFDNVINGVRENLLNYIWNVFADLYGGVFEIQKVYPPYRAEFNVLTIILYFDNLVDLSGSGTRIKVRTINASTNVEIDNQEITGNTYVYAFSPDNIFVRFEIQALTLLSFQNLSVNFRQEQWGFTTVDDPRGRPLTLFTRSIKQSIATAPTNSSSLNSEKVNLIATLPNMKAVDFLKSFFKMLNIKVISTGLQDNSMYWLTEKDINEKNKVWSKRLVDYTPYTLTKTLNKTIATKYDKYIFKHKESKYYESKYGDGTYFGSLEYPTGIIPKAKTFEVKTEYSILNINYNLQLTTGPIATAYPFSNEDIEVNSNFALRYKPIFNEFTIFYNNYIDIGSANMIGFKASNNFVYGVTRLYQPVFFNVKTGNSLAFGNEKGYANSLYVNNYKNIIEFLLNPKCYESEFEIQLPANEIFLNFANQTQGEENISVGFRPQNEIIIGEQKYKLVESLINLTTGKGKLKLINY